MPQVFENIIEQRTDTGMLVRVWFNRSLDGPTVSEHAQQLHDALRYAYIWKEPLELAINLEKHLVGVNAIQVSFGNTGSVYYPEWP